MKTTTDYSETDLYRGKCRSCGERTDIVRDSSGIDEQYVDWCPECIESDKFFDSTL